MRAGAILVVGEALADLVPHDGEPSGRRALLGGSGFNTALALARCGASVAYHATLSTDELGARFSAALDAEGIDSRLVARSDRPIPHAEIAALADDGSATYRFWLDGTALAEPPAPPASLAGLAHLHVTSFGATAGPSGEAALTLMRCARREGLSVSYDINIRPGALPDMATTLRLVEERAALCDLVKLSVEDGGQLFGNGWRTAFDRWFAQGVALVLQTKGDAGADLMRACGGKTSSFMPAPGLVDTIGAGDAFIGAFLASLAAAGELGPALRDMSDAPAASAMDFAALVAAETCGVAGCDPPRLLPPPPHE